MSVPPDTPWVAASRTPASAHTTGTPKRQAMPGVVTCASSLIVGWSGVSGGWDNLIAPAAGRGAHAEVQGPQKERLHRPGGEPVVGGVLHRPDADGAGVAVGFPARGHRIRRAERADVDGKPRTVELRDRVFFHDHRLV